LVNILGDLNPVVISTPVPITVTLKPLSTSTTTTTLLGPATQLYNSTASAATLFNNLSLKNPIVGTYQLNFTAPDIQWLAVNFNVLPGLPYAFVLVNGTDKQTVIANDFVPLKPIQLCLIDEVGNPTYPRAPMTVSVSGGVASPIMMNTQCIDFPITLQAPVGNTIYNLEFKSSDFENIVIASVTVLPGTPRTLGFKRPPPLTTANFITTLDIQPILEIYDFSGSIISDNYSVSVTIRPKNETWNVAIEIGQTTALIADSQVAFTSLAFRGQRGGYYQMFFAVDGFPQANISAEIYILRCEEQTIRDNTVTADTGYDCLCLAGYGYDNSTLQCSPCPADTYKALNASTSCAKCDTKTDTNGETGKTFCYCQKGLLDEAIYSGVPGCVDCPEGGICEKGRIVGIQEGYWRPENASDLDISFYPCHRGNPSRKESDAAKSACPGSVDSLTATCGAGYQGIRCLSCTDGYGLSGPFCEGMLRTIV
jgi:hypothetical protein